MLELRRCRLRNVTVLITKGTTPTTVGYGFTKEGINFIKAEAITLDGRIDQSKFVYIDEITHRKLRRSQINEGDILFSIAGMKLGKSAIAGRGHVPANTNQAVAIIRADRNKVHPPYLHYYFLNPDHYRYVNALPAQSAQPNINLTQIGDLPIELPSIPSQRRITDILSTYDDLIENNLRRIRILEEMAHTIYREWFVYFRFPGNEKVRRINSSVGPIPEGWQVTVVKDILARHPAGRAYREADVEQDGTTLVIDQSTSELLGFHGNAPSGSSDHPHPCGEN